MKDHSEEETLIVARCPDSVNAHLIQGRLENEGIASIIHNDFRAYDIGTVDVLVYAKDYDRAYQIVHTSSPELTTETIVCPYCGSTDISPAPRSKNKFVNNLILLMALFCSIFIRASSRTRYRCNKCNNQFEHI